jgi:hypothetical protein
MTKIWTTALIASTHQLVFEHLVHLGVEVRPLLQQGAQGALATLEEVDGVRLVGLALHETIIELDAGRPTATTRGRFATGGRVDAIWDRAALVAVDPKDRGRYRDALLQVLVPGGVILLVTFTYDQSKLPGPPWSVSDDDVKTLFGGSCAIEKLAARQESPGPKFTDAGAHDVVESVFLLTKRA